MATNENLELARLQFEDHGASSPQFLVRRGPSFFRETTDHSLGLGQRDVAFKSVLRGHSVSFQAVRNSADR